MFEDFNSYEEGFPGDQGIGKGPMNLDFLVKYMVAIGFKDITEEEAFGPEGVVPKNNKTLQAFYDRVDKDTLSNLYLNYKAYSPKNPDKELDRGFIACFGYDIETHMPISTNCKCFAKELSGR